MRIILFKFYLFLILIVIPYKGVNSEVFIVAKVNQEIITNIDLNFEKRYLVSLNPNLKKLDQKKITEYAKNSLINEKIKKIEIEKRFKIIPNETILAKVIGDIYSSIGISSLTEFEDYLLQNKVDIKRVKEKISVEIAWNDLIVKTFSNEIEIDQNAISKELEKFDEKEVNNLLLSEIIFTVNDKNEFEPKLKAIKESINEIGFEETARIYSLSDSKKSGGNLGTDGSVSYMFKKVGLVNFNNSSNENLIMEVALESGAEDVVNNDDGTIDVIVEPDAFVDLKEAMVAAALEPISAEITLVSEQEVELTHEKGEALFKMLDLLEDLDDVQRVYTNASVRHDS